MREDHWITERFVDLMILLIRPFEKFHSWNVKRKYGVKV